MSHEFEHTEYGEHTDSSDSMFQNSCVSRLCDNDSCHFVRLNKNFPFLSHHISTPPGVAKTESPESTESTESGESGESPESTVFDNLWSIHGNLCFSTYNP